ncbi:MAG: single-stranded-DNA-specific exonuclease RecJ [Planctomycetota bacterium]
MTRTWRLRELERSQVEALARARHLPEIVASLLVARGLADPEVADRFLAASPMGLYEPALLPGVEAGSERVRRAIDAGETILVHGDYDVDGVTGTAILVRALRLFGAKVVWHIPNRLTDGYSFGPHSLEVAQREGATLVVSVDNGTSAHDVIGVLKRHGIDTVVTDHHEPPDGPLPDAVAIVNPKLDDSSYPFRELCGGAVAFKFAWGLAQSIEGTRRVRPEVKTFLEDATALVAIATVCDVVPLVDENRLFARFGLKALKATSHPGLRALLTTCGLTGRRLGADDVGFQIGPRINASGRLGSAATAVELMLSEDITEARRLSARLDELNQERKRIESEVLAAARVEARRFADRERHPVLVVAGSKWHVGVVGIVAARLVEEFGRPALVLGQEGAIARGSARSVEGFDVLAAMKGAADIFTRFGGHAAAAGCEIDFERVDEARAAIEARARELLGAGPLAAPDLVIDHELPFETMTEELMRQLDRLEPFGQENERPLLLARAVHLEAPPRILGRDQTHLMLQLRRGSHAIKAMAFGMAKRAPELRLGSRIDLVFRPKWNTFRGQTNLEVELVDFRGAESGTFPSPIRSG